MVASTPPATPPEMRDRIGEILGFVSDFGFWDGKTAISLDLSGTWVLCAFAIAAIAYTDVGMVFGVWCW